MVIKSEVRSKVSRSEYSPFLNRWSRLCFDGKNCPWGRSNWQIRQRTNIHSIKQTEMWRINRETVEIRNKKVFDRRRHSVQDQFFIIFSVQSYVFDPNSKNRLHPWQTEWVSLWLSEGQTGSKSSFAPKNCIRSKFAFSMQRDPANQICSSVCPKNVRCWARQKLAQMILSASIENRALTSD